MAYESFSSWAVVSGAGTACAIAFSCSLSFCMNKIRSNASI